MIHTSRTVLVTGSSSGIGLETAIELGRRGHRVLASMRSLEGQHGLVRRRDALGLRDLVMAVELDVAQPKPVVQAVLARLSEQHGPVEVLINNAGVAVLGPVETLSESSWRRIMDTNFFGALNCIQALVPSMREHRRGTIINVSSVSGRVASAGFGAYASSKFALEGLSEALRQELMPFGVSVSVVEPGNYRTRVSTLRPYVAGASEDARPSPYPHLQDALDAFHASLPRVAGNAAEVARLIGDIVEADRPAFRYPVGMVGDMSADAWIATRSAAWDSKALPTRDFGEA